MEIGRPEWTNFSGAMLNLGCVITSFNKQVRFYATFLWISCISNFFTSSPGSPHITAVNETLEVRKLFCPYGALLWRPKKATAVGENPLKNSMFRCKEYLPTFSFKKKNMVFMSVKNPVPWMRLRNLGNCRKMLPFRKMSDLLAVESAV